MLELDYKNSGYGGLFAWMGHPEQKKLPHMHTDVELNFVCHGQVTYLIGGKIQVITEHDLVIFWAVTPHCIIAADEATRLGVVHIPLGDFLRWELPPEFVSPVLHGQVLGQVSRQAPLDTLQFESWAADTSFGFAGADIEAYKTTLLEIEARVWRMAQLSAHLTHKTVPPDLSKLPKMEQVAIFVALNYRQPITAQDLAEVAGLHPNYVMNLFRKTMGQTLTDYLTMHRVAHAQRLLISTQRSILDVAMDAGFGSLSRFYAAFRQNVGTTPRQYRAVYGLSEGMLHRARQLEAVPV